MNNKLDLHGTRHVNVDRKVENFVFLNQNNFPLTIITGYSGKMKCLVKEVLDRNNFSYKDGDYSGVNAGVITVFGFK